MALKMDRDIVATEYAFTMNNAASPGGIASLESAGSGVAANDDTNTVVEYVADPSGAKPIGLLLNEVVDIDTTKYRLNYYKQEVLVGSKVSLMREGMVVTDLVIGTPTDGGAAYINSSGNLGVDNISDAINAIKVGQFLSDPDENGFVKVWIDIPGGNVS